MEKSEVKIQLFLRWNISAGVCEIGTLREDAVFMDVCSITIVDDSLKSIVQDYNPNAKNMCTDSTDCCCVHCRLICIPKDLR